MRGIAGIINSGCWTDIRIKWVQIPLLDKMVQHILLDINSKVHDSNSSPRSNNHCTRARSLQTVEMSGHPPVSCPPPLLLSSWMSCHLSMKECQAFSQSDWQFLLFRFSGCFKRVVMCYLKDYPPQQVVFQASTPGESPASFYYVWGDLWLKETSFASHEPEVALLQVALLNSDWILQVFWWRPSRVQVS